MRKTTLRVCAVSITLSTLSLLSTSPLRLSAQARNVAGAMNSSKRMAAGKQWTTHNLDVDITPSFCYENAERNCRQYGRLYTWESAQRACKSLGDGWRLPTDD